MYGAADTLRARSANTLRNIERENMIGKSEWTSLDPLQGNYLSNEQSKAKQSKADRETGG